MNALAGLMNPAAVGQSVTQALKFGQQKAQQEKARNAFAAYATNPTEETLAANAQYNPQLVISERQRMQQQAAAQQKQAFEMFPKMAQLLGSATDEQTYQQALGMARQFGIPGVENAPLNFDPAWVQQNLAIAQALTEGGPEALSAIGKEVTDAGYKPGTPEFAQQVQQRLVSKDSRVVSYEPGGGAARIGPDGSVTPLIVPNPGGAAAGAPVGSGPQEGATATNPKTGAKIIYRGGKWQPMGGGAGNGASGFRGVEGERVTSGYRNPEHNRRVGGVKNSYHTRRFKNGNPMARDSVPPPGMSMAAYAAQLQRLNPDMKVINEGDHVHMEPRN